MANELKVLMVGGRRCGKTSALASLFDQIINGPVNNTLTVSDQTKHVVKQRLTTGKEEEQDSLNDKRLELTDKIQKGGTGTFMLDQNPTYNYWDYRLRVQMPGSSEHFMDIVFRDSGGEFFDNKSKHYAETAEFVKQCDVFLVVIDTPYLMQESTVDAEAANQVGSIRDVLTNISGEKAKQVIFVPIKCEKWVKEGKIKDVVEKVKSVYATTLKHLGAYDKMEITIMPVETAGDIIFDEMLPSCILYDTVTRTEKKCSPISDSLVRLANGKMHKVRPHEIINEDINATYVGTNIERPAPWYFLNNTGKKAVYSPHNCEQIPLHIIRFMFNKVKKESTNRVDFRYLGPLGYVLEKIIRELMKRMGFNTMSFEDIQKSLDTLSAAGLIKDNVEGITTIKKCF